MAMPLPPLRSRRRRERAKAGLGVKIRTERLRDLESSQALSAGQYWEPQDEGCKGVPPLWKSATPRGRGGCKSSRAEEGNASERSLPGLLPQLHWRNPKARPARVQEPGSGLTPGRSCFFPGERLAPSVWRVDCLANRSRPKLGRLRGCGELRPPAWPSPGRVEPTHSALRRDPASSAPCTPGFSLAPLALRL